MSFVLPENGTDPQDDQKIGRMQKTDAFLALFVLLCVLATEEIFLFYFIFSFSFWKSRLMDALLTSPSSAASNILPLQISESFAQTV